MLGAHLAFALTSSGKKIRALKRKASSTAATERTFQLYSKEPAALLSRIEWVDGDLLDLGSLEDAMEGITQIYHAAALVSYHPSEREKMVNANIEGTANLINLALEFRIEKFCHISSVAALGRTTDGSVIDENIWWKTSPDNSWYAISKYGAEREVWRATEEGLDVIILNPSLIIGPGDGERSSTELFGRLKKGTAWYTKGVTGYVDARDVAEAALRLMESKIVNERFILNAVNLSFREVIDKILTGFGKAKSKYEAGPFLIGFGWRMEKFLSRFTGRRPRITKETALASQLVSHFGGNRITERTGFTYRDMDKTIEEVCRYY